MAGVLVETSEQIRVRLVASLGEITNNVLRKVSPKLELLVKQRVRGAINNSPTIASILNRDTSLITLQAQFGLTDRLASEAVDQILDAVIKSIHVTANLSRKYAKAEFIGSLTVTILPEYFAQNLKILAGSYISEPSGIDIPWLQWLLLEGTRVVVGGWRVFESDSTVSRSDTGVIMVEGGFFNVDSSHSGTEGDNFITRAVDEVKDDIANDIRTLVKAEF